VVVACQGGEARLMDESSDAVMMEWEKPLMQLHAQVGPTARGSR
jgi:hypothetical protein